MYKIYTEDDILAIVKKFDLYYNRISSYMYLIGLTKNYIIGNIAIISNEIICTIHFNRGYNRYVEKFPYEPGKFVKLLKKAHNGSLEIQQYQLDKLLDEL